MYKEESDLLSVSDLSTYFFTIKGTVHAVDGVSLYIEKGETLGLAGESGCGKSTTAYSILKIVSEPGRIVSGSILFKGEDLVKKDEGEMQRIRGGEISIIFQEPRAAVNPIIKLGDQIAESIKLHRGLGDKEASAEAIKMLELLGTSNPEAVSEGYAFQYGPGVVQQAMIAMALSCHANLLIADEPTSAMDASTQARTISLLKELKRKLNFSMLYITHNLGVIAQLCDRVAIMYAGSLVEIGETKSFFKDPMHPYSDKLLHAFPRYDIIQDRLPEIPGAVPSLIDPPPGCRFYPRCPLRKEICKEREPSLTEVKPNRLVACWAVEG